MFRWLRRPITRRQKIRYRSRPPGGVQSVNSFYRLTLLVILVFAALAYADSKGWI